MIHTKIVIGTDALLECAKTLLKRGEITQEDFKVMQERNKSIIPEHRGNVIISKEV